MRPSVAAASLRTLAAAACPAFYLALTHSPTCLSSSAHRLEELELQVQVAHQVNAHLNAEVERMTAAVEALQAERAAFERHIKDLAAKLSAARAALPEAQAAAQAEADAEAAEEAEAAAGEGALVSDRFAADLPSSRDLASGTSIDGGGEPKSAEEKGSDLQPWLQDGAWQRLQAAGRRQSWLVGPEEVILGEVIGKGTFGEAACPLVGCSAMSMRCRPPGIVVSVAANA